MSLNFRRLKIEKTYRELFLVVALLIITVGSAILFYFAYLDGVSINPVIKFNNTTLITEKNEYKPGEIVKAKIDYCKYRHITPTVQWSLTDTYLKYFPERKGGIIELGCKSMIIEVEKIPMDTYPGQYYFSGLVKYRVNGMRELSYELTTNKFMIVK